MIRLVNAVRSPTLRSESGFTIVESMVALLILITGLVATFVLVDVANSRSAATRAREGANNVARQIAESARTIPYRDITDASVQTRLQAISGLADARPQAGWQLERRGYLYTVTTAVCSVDDPKDALGSHTGKVFCADSATEGLDDAQPEDFRRLVTGVSWRENGATRTVRLRSTISSTGQAVGLPVSDLRLSSPASDPPGVATDPVISNAATVSLTFTATAPAAAQSLIWTVDGQTMTPPATRSATDPTKWTLSWSVPLADVTDGAYRIGVQAVDAQTVAGPERQIQVLIARTGPAAPSGVVAGYNVVRSNGADVLVVEARWLANKEKSVTGYKVYRPDGSAVCTLTADQQTACIDFSPPPMTATDRTYKVVALYRDPAGTPLESAPGTDQATVTDTTKGLVRPPAPTGLTAAAQADGTVKLRWTAPAGGAEFYRIYRDGIDVTNRLGFTGSGTEVEFFDRAPTGANAYYVTAVDANLTESTPVGPVTP